MEKLKNESKPPFYKTGPIYLTSDDPAGPSSPKATKSSKKPGLPGYQPLGDADKMKGDSVEAQAFNTINAKAQKKIKADHKQRDLATKSVKIGDKFGMGHKVVGINSKTGDVLSRKGNRSTVYKTSRRDAQRYSRSIGKGYSAPITPQKIKYDYDSDGSIIEVK
jgi:hypothetical protein